MEAQPDAPARIRPCYFRFHVQLQVSPGQSKVQTKKGIPRKRLLQQKGNSSFADIRAGRCYFLVTHDHPDWHLYLLAEIAAPFS